MEHRFFFFAGGEYRENDNNAFTANFINIFSDVLGDRFTTIKGIYNPRPLMNVVWALNRAQKPVRTPEQDPIIYASVSQILSDPLTRNSIVTLVSSSYGSVVAAQAACYLAEIQAREPVMSRPFDVVLGASMVSKESELYRQLVTYQEKGIIGTIIYDELQDEGDNSNGTGGRTRFEAYTNALGICFPFLTRKFKGPSFLNTNPVTGHLHRVRSKSVQKARDFVRVILIDYQLGGSEVLEAAQALIQSTERI